MDIETGKRYQYRFDWDDPEIERVAEVVDSILLGSTEVFCFNPEEHGEPFIATRDIVNEGSPVYTTDFDPHVMLVDLKEVP